MMVHILYEDDALLVAIKPQGMPTQADKTGDLDFLSALEEAAGQPLGLLHRLDRPVGGVMLFAKQKSAEAFMAQEIREHRLKKRYLAVLCGKPPMTEGGLENYLLKNARTNLSEVVSKERRGAKRAALQYRVLAERKTDAGVLSLAEILLETGRHHQIRVQTAYAGCPIWGDRKYHKSFPRGGRADIALWAYRVEGIHPETKKPFSFTALPQGEPFSLFAKELEEL